MATRSRKALFIQYRNTYSKNAITSGALSFPINSEGYDSSGGKESEMVGLIRNENSFENKDYNDIKQEIIPMTELTNLPPAWYIYKYNKNLIEVLGTLINKVLFIYLTKYYK